MSEAAVTIRIDERARLVTAILAAGDWPQREQAQLAHAVHPHAKQARQFMRNFSHHPAVQAANEALSSDVAVDDLFTAALRCDWPTFTPLEPLPGSWQSDTWVKALAGLAPSVALGRFWAEHEAVWAEACNDLQNVFQTNGLIPFLSRLQGQAVTHTIHTMPNLVYPALASVLAPTRETLILLLPPPKAVGESPPWPYREDPGLLLAQACDRLVGHLLAAELAQLDATGQILFKRAAVTLFLEQAIDKSEAMSYLLRSKKEHNLPQLPHAVDQLRQRLKT